MRIVTKKILVSILCSAVLLAGCSSNTPPAAPALPGVDITPDQFNFADQTNVASGAEITSAAITITGINAATSVSSIGGSYSVNGGAFITTPGTLTNGASVRVRHTSAASAGTATHTTLTVDGVSDTFSSTTAGSSGSDTTPDPFSFTDQTGVAVSSVITSATVTITGITSPAVVTVTGGSYSVGCTSVFTTIGTVINNNQTVCVRHTSSASASTATNTVLTVGGVSDTFTSTTAGSATVSGLLPFLTGTGQLQLLDPAAAISGTNPKTVDTGLAPPPPGDCTAELLIDDCFGKAEAFYSGTVTGTAVSNLHAARLAYAKRAPGNNTGGAVFKLNMVQGASNTPVRISSLTDACRIVRSETTDWVNVDNSAVVVERAGPDLKCSGAGAETADNVATVIRLNSLSTDAGISIPLALDTGNPLHAQTDASGAITGWVSFEISGVNALLVRRAANLASPVTLLAMADTTGANIERTDLTHLFVTATPVDDRLTLFRVESTGILSSALYFFAGFNAGNPIQDGLHDATNLYFSDENMLLRIPVNAAAENATVITTLIHPNPLLTLRIAGNRVLDTGATPDRVVFEAQDDSLTVASGVFSAEVTANGATATTLKNYPDSEGGSATLLTATHGVAYINVTDHGDDEFPNDADDALKINTNGAGASTILSAYWAGSNSVTSFNLATDFAVPAQFIFLASRVVVDGAGADTLRVVDPATGVAGAVLGTVNGAGNFQAVKITGLGRYALARAEIVRDTGISDHDVYFLDAGNASSLTPLAETSAATDLPLGTRR